MVTATTGRQATNLRKSTFKSLTQTSIKELYLGNGKLQVAHPIGQTHIYQKTKLLGPCLHWSQTFQGKKIKFKGRRLVTEQK